MKSNTRRNLIFIAGSLATFALASTAAAFGMIRVINWYLSNCAVASSGCAAANWLIDYWWLLFVPAILIATVLVHRLYIAGKPTPPPKTM